MTHSLPRLLIALALAGAALGANPPTATLDPHVTLVPHFMGLGVQWDPYEYPPAAAEWKLTLARLDFMKPAFFRVMTTADTYCLGFDSSGHPQYVWDLDDAKIHERLGSLFQILDYAQSRNVDVMLGEWQPSKSFAGPQDPRWPNAIADFVKYLIAQKKYSAIRYYNFFNEPNGNWMWPQGKVDYDAWAAGLRLLRREFDARGLQSLPIAGPDNSGDWDWLDRCAQDLRDQIGFWEMHWYVKDKELFDGGIETLLRDKREMLLKTDPDSPSKNLYIGEAGVIQGRVNGDQQPRVKDYDYGVLMSDFVAQVARAGWMGASAWDLDDALHVVNGRPHPAIPDALTLKIWGFWNTQGNAMGHPEDEAVRPWFYPWSLMSRLFPKGTRIIAVKETDWLPGLRTMAAVNAGGTSVMLVNDAAEALTVAVRIPQLSGKKLTRYDYFDPVPRKTQAKLDAKGAVQLDLPAHSVVFLTSAHMTIVMPQP